MHSPRRHDVLGLNRFEKTTFTLLGDSKFGFELIRDFKWDSSILAFRFRVSAIDWIIKFGVGGFAPVRRLLDWWNLFLTLQKRSLYCHGDAPHHRRPLYWMLENRSFRNMVDHGVVELQAACHPYSIGVKLFRIMKKQIVMIRFRKKTQMVGTAALPFWRDRMCFECTCCRRCLISISW